MNLFAAHETFRGGQSFKVPAHAEIYNGLQPGDSGEPGFGECLKKGVL